MSGTISIGQQKVATALLEMPGMESLIHAYDRPLRGVSMLVCITPTPETGVFLTVLTKLGAKVAACSDNAFASDDDVVAFIESKGMAIFAKANMSQKTYFDSMEKAIAEVKTDEVIQIADDGCDMTQYIAEHHAPLLPKVRVITEQTTCGIHFLKHLYAHNKITVPAVNINHCFTKQWFDNNIGIQQSLIHGLTAAGVSLPGKAITIFGFGPLGQGAAYAMRASGAKVSIVETDIIALMQAELQGYKPISAEAALQTSDICLTATGCIDTIDGAMIEQYARSGLMLGNIGHGTSEYDVLYLGTKAKKSTLNPHIDAFTLPDGRIMYSLCKGALVNFLAGGGNMSRIMSLTFSLTVLAHIQAASAPDRLTEGLHSLDKALEYETAEHNFAHLRPLLYKLSDEQREYLKPMTKGVTG